MEKLMIAIQKAYDVQEVGPFLMNKHYVTTLILGSRPKQRQGKVQAKSAIPESHLHS
jgi:hypothetical protein